MKDFSTICVPFECGCDRQGASLAPKWLVDSSVILSQVSILNLECLKVTKTKLSNGIKNYEEVGITCRRLRDTVSNLKADGKCLLTIGGDHSIALGSIAGVLEHNPNIGVIWFDAHGDVNTEATSPSANAHGMPVAALMGLCKSGINDIATTHLKPQNIFWVGARDLDLGESETIEKLEITDNVYSTERVHEMGMASVMDEIRCKMESQGIEEVHLSFDIDGMDPSIVWATGTRVNDGLLQEDLDSFVEGLARLPEMKSMDFVEYNPLLDDEDRTTGKWCVETLKRLIEK